MRERERERKVVSIVVFQWGCPREPQVRVTVSFGFIQLVKDLTILG